MKKHITVISLLMSSISFIYSPSKAQVNLIGNPSFEDTIQCPNGPGLLGYAKNWYLPNGGSSDYFNKCNTDSNWFSTPSNAAGFQYPRTGNAYAGIVLFSTNNDNNYREYVRCKLKDFLKANSRYCLEFYVSLADSAGIAVSNIGAFFSKSDTIDSTSASYFNFQPQVKNIDSVFITDKQNWVKISGCFVAQGNENYITIGNFSSDSNTYKQILSQTIELSVYSYYYLDDILLFEDTNTSFDNGALPDQISIFPNPCSDYFMIRENTAAGKICEIILCDNLGDQLLECKVQQSEQKFDIRKFHSGFYILKIKYCNNSSSNFKLIINN